jgi:hypothetical protein
VKNNMSYKVSTRSSHERRELIKNGVEASAEKHRFYEYQNRPTDLPIIRIEIGIPIYRMANYRTRVEQRRYVHDHAKGQEFFDTGQENESAQQAQHEILEGFAKQGRASSVKPIFEELQEESQREPLIITADGVVVNGNRRLAAMRELFTGDPSGMRHFSHVNCAVLPSSVTADEVREIEVRLQMQPETKLPYGWVNESLAITELLQSGKKSDYIAELMKRSKKDVERAARALIEADLFLKEWLKQPGEYQYVEEAQQFFSDLASSLGNKEGESLELSRRIAWALLSNQRKLRTRIYDYNFSFGKRAEEVATKLAERSGIELTGSASVEDDSDELAIDLEPDEDSFTFEPLIEAFDYFEDREALIEELVAVCDSLIEQDRQGETGRRALAAVTAANSKLQEVDLTKAEPGTYNAIKAQLDAVLARATALQGSLEKYRDSS